MVEINITIWRRGLVGNNCATIIHHIDFKMTSVVTVVSRKSAHGRGTLQARQGGGWEALFKFEPRKSAHVMFTANWANNNVQQYNPVDFYHNRVDSK